MPTGKDITELKDKLKATRYNFESHWQDCATYIMPRKATVTRKHVVGGEKRTDDVYDSTAVEANELFAASLHGMLVNPAGLWFKVESESEELNDLQEVNQFFTTATKRMHAKIHDPKADFTGQLDEVFLDIGCFGTGPLFLQENVDGDLRFKSLPLGSTYIDENDEGVVDVCIMEEELTAHAIKDRYQLPDDSIPKEVREAMDVNPMQKSMVTIAIMPRRLRDKSKIDKKNMAYASYHVFDATSSVIRESGYNEFPVMAPRWRKTTGEKYGRSPGMKVLPDIKYVNAGSRALMEATEKALFPPMQVPHNAFTSRLRTSARAINYYIPMQPGDRAEPLLTVGDIPLTHEMLEQRRLAIREGFYQDQLQLTQGPDMTAFEVAQRQSEKLRLMSPMLGRIQSELLSPIIDRVFNIMLRNGEFGPIPQALQGTETKIRYLSSLALAQQSTDAQSIVSTLQIGAQMDQMAAQTGRPPVTGNIDMDMSFRIVARDSGFPPEAMLSEEDVQGDRQRAAESQQQEQEIQQAERAADVASKLLPAQQSGQTVQ